MNRSVVIPAHNEAATVRRVVEAVHSDADEVIVVASSCTDDTESEARKGGAIVIREPILGKHYALRAGLGAARGKHVAFVDADLLSPISGIAERLFQGLKPGVLLAKGYYRRAFDGEARLTEICARPLLSITIPELARIRDPLCGEFAVVRERAMRWHFAPGFAVDLGFLMSAALEGEICEVDLGEKQHKHRSVFDLGLAAAQVSATILSPRFVATARKVQVHQYPDGCPTSIDVDTGFLNPLVFCKG